MIVPLQKDVLSQLADTQSRDIFLCILDYGKISSSDIQKRTKIPVTTLYRKIKSLVKLNLITEETIKTPNQYGPWHDVSYYTSSYSKLTIKISKKDFVKVEGVCN